MTRLSIEHHVAEFPPEAVVAWAVGLMLGPFDIVGGIHWAQTFAMPGTFSPQGIRILERTIEQLEDNRSIVDDPDLHEAIQRISAPLVEFVSVAKEIRNWERTAIPSALRTAHTHEVESRGPMHPEWATNPDFWRLMNRSTAACHRYIDSLDFAIPAIQRIMAAAGSDLYRQQIERVISQAPDFRVALVEGYEELIKRGAAGQAGLPSG